MSRQKEPPHLGHNFIRVEIVTTLEQLQHAYAIRAICFMEENDVDAGQAFDGNDLQATHVIIYADTQPIGALRIRWFNNFAKIERTAFRKAFRNPRYLKMTAEFVFMHIARKGYARVLTHANPLYARLWRVLLGFKEVEHKPGVIFDGHTEPYIELVKHLEVPQNAITADTDPTVLFRIEGQWDQKSKYESAN